MGTEGSGASRAGGEGFHNEDVFLVDEGLGLYLVCDGVSDTPAGEVAARVASEALDEFIERAEEDFDLRAERAAGVVVQRAMRHAMAAVTGAEQGDAALHGLATTITMLLVHGRIGVIGHCGDSRAYLLRRGRGIQLTLDHALSEAFLDAADDAFDVFAVDLEPGDTVVLCSDGAEAVMDDQAILRAASGLSPRVLASRIVSAANRRSPDVDATAVVVRVQGDREPGWLALSGEPENTTYGHRLRPQPAPAD